LGDLGRRIRPIDRDTYGASLIDVDQMNAYRFFALQAGAIGDAELPVVPLARDHLAIETTLGEPVPLVWAGVVDGVNPGCCADKADATTVSLHHRHRADLQICKLSNNLATPCGLEVCIGGRRVSCAHASTR
jgi:hypothetical protein